MSNPRNPTPPNLTPGLAGRAPRTMVEISVVVDRVAAELAPAALEVVRVPLERTVPTDGRGVLLVFSRATTDIFGQVVEYEVPRVVHRLVHDGAQPFVFAYDAVTSQAVYRLVERARQMRVDVFVARTAEQFAELRAQWRA